MKCHDIRHKLGDYHLPITDDEEKELKSLIRIYDQTYRTGSQTLDVLLADRTLLCEKDHIQLSFLGDGSCLKSLTEADVYSLLGNALGNAVEAARRVEEEKRQISMIIRNSGDLVSISVTNYYQGQLHFEEDLPVTTQPDAEDFHRYGMKSMQAIAEKYGGKLMVDKQHGCILNISSMNAYIPLTKIPAYSGAKAAISNFTQWLATHFAGSGIRCNAIAPGFLVSN
ncbi:MAG: SDR family NAD(P)-dependent oxidoreductase, partial [Pseudoflavonifractor capillosus]